MNNENFRIDVNRKLYYEYIGFWNNLDYETQVESRPLTYSEFIRHENKTQLIDSTKSMIYNKGK